MNPLYYLAQSNSGYGCGNFGQSDSYGTCNSTDNQPPASTTETTQAAPENQSLASTLQNTGAGAFLPLVVSIIIIVVAVALFKKRKA